MLVLSFVIVLFSSILIYLKTRKSIFEDKSVPLEKQEHFIPYATTLAPFRLPFIDGFYHLYQLQTEGLGLLERQSREYGDLFIAEYGPITTLVVANASIAEKILSASVPAANSKLKLIYDWFLLPWYKDGPLDYNVWHASRKILVPLSNLKCSVHLTKIINHSTLQLVKTLKSCTTNCQAIYGDGLFDAIHFCVLKIFAETAMGKTERLNKELVKFGQTLFALKQVHFERVENPYLLIAPIWHLHDRKEEYDIDVAYINNFLQNTIQEYRVAYEKLRQEVQTETEENANKPFGCVVEQMLCCEASDKEIYDKVRAFIDWGVETISTTLKMLLLQLALNETHQTTCRDEVDKLFAGKGFDESLNGTKNFEISKDDLSNLKYLERCILETLRISPACPMFFQRLDAPVTINENLKLPAGTILTFVPWILHRNADHFSYPDKFDPDRFLAKNVAKRHPYAYMPFSTESRNCVELKWTMLAMKIIIAWLLHNFEVVSSDKFNDAKLLFETTLSLERNCNINLKRRNIVYKA